MVRGMAGVLLHSLFCALAFVAIAHGQLTVNDNVTLKDQAAIRQASGTYTTKPRPGLASVSKHDADLQPRGRTPLGDQW